jgi:hypothetical protein
MRFRPLLLLLPLVALTGCLQVDALVKVKPDGSGTIEQKVMMTAATVAQMKSMMAFGGDKAGGKSGELFDEAKLKSEAAAMGEGVTFVAGKKVTAPDGGEGYTATYAFTDISKLKLKNNPSAFAPGGGALQMKSSSKQPPVTFQFTKGRPAELTIVNTRVKSAKKEEAPAADDPAQEAMLPMMQQALKDMRMLVAIEVEGKIAETNAQWREGSRVTVMDMDVNKLLADPAKFKALTKIKDPNSAEGKALLASVPGVKIETADAVKIKFQ